MSPRSVSISPYLARRRSAVIVAPVSRWPRSSGKRAPKVRRAATSMLAMRLPSSTFSSPRTVVSTSGSSGTPAIWRTFPHPARGERMSDEVNFGDELVTRDEKTRRVGRVFSSVARRYDLMNDLMRGGMHRLWKDRFVARVKPRPGEAILDMAGGTGDVAFRMARARRPRHGQRHQRRHARRRHGAGRGARARGPELEAGKCREPELRRPELRRLHDRLRHPERHRHPRRASRGAPRAQAWRPLLLPRILDQRLAGLRRRLRSLFEARDPADRPRRRRRRGELPLPRRIRSAASPRCPSSGG